MENQDPIQDQTSEIPQNIEQPGQTPALDPAPVDPSHFYKWLLAGGIVVITAIVGLLVWQFLPKSEKPSNQSTTFNNSKNNMTNDNFLQSELENVYTRYLQSLKDRDFDAFSKTVDPDGEIKLVEMKARFEAFSGMANEPEGFGIPLSENKFIETRDISVVAHQGDGYLKYWRGVGMSWNQLAMVFYQTGQNIVNDIQNT